MGFLSRLLGRNKSAETPAPDLEAPPCPHVALIAKWDNVQDMGDESKATGFTCSACGDSFTPDQAEELRSSQAERLKGSLS